MADTLESVLAARLKATRAALGLSQADIASRMTALGVPTKVPAVSMVESGRRKLSVTELATIIRAIGGDAEGEVRRALFTTAGVGAGSVARQLRSLGGDDLSGDYTAAAPDPEVGAAAAVIATDRQRERVLDGIARAIPWRTLGLGKGLDQLAPLDDFHRGLILDTLEDLFGSRDILEVRDMFVEDANRADRDGGAHVTAEQFAQYRGWATRRVTDLLIGALSR